MFQQFLALSSCQKKNRATRQTRLLEKCQNMKAKRLKTVLNKENIEQSQAEVVVEPNVSDIDEDFHWWRWHKCIASCTTYNAWMTRNARQTEDVGSQTDDIHFRNQQNFQYLIDQAQLIKQYTHFCHLIMMTWVMTKGQISHQTLACYCFCLTFFYCQEWQLLTEVWPSW